VTYLKIKSGTLRARDAFRFGDTVEKVHQIRLYRGTSFTTCDEAHAGDAVGVTGLSAPRCGNRMTADTLGESVMMRTTPVLSARVEPPQGTAPAVLLEKLRILEDEEPMLGVAWDAAHSAVTVQVMGTVQTEVLTQLMENRFGMKVRFLPPLVLYKETIAAPVVGCGHYEPLRHYAETHLRHYKHLMGQAVAVHYTTDIYHDGCMRERNRYMVDHASYCIAYYNGSPRSGSGQTLRMAKKAGIEICNLHELL